MPDAPKPPPPPSPRPDHAPAPPGDAPPPKPVDLKKLPSGHVPEAWKNLPPPTIVRAEPPPQKDAKAKTQEFLKSRAAKQIGIGIAALLLLVVVVFSFKPRNTTHTPVGTTKLFCAALENRDLAGMQAVCTGAAAAACEGLLAQIAEIEAAHTASPFKSARPVVESNPAGETAPGYIVCEGENGDDFLRINFVAEKQADENWHMTMMATEALSQ